MECLQKYLPECSNDSGAVALRKMIQDIVCLNHSFILYLVYVLLSVTAPAICNYKFSLKKAAIPS